MTRKGRIIVHDTDLYDDDGLLRALREALASAQHPRNDLVIANAQDAFSYASLEEEFARLVYDSVREQDQLAVLRAAGPERTVVFECEALSMELEFSTGTVLGQIAPPGEHQVTVEDMDGQVAQVDTDSLGCFSLPMPPAAAGSRLRFRIRRQGGSAVTEWTYGWPAA